MNPAAWQIKAIFAGVALLVERLIYSVLAVVIASGLSFGVGHHYGVKHTTDEFKAAEAQQLADSVVQRDAYIANLAEMARLKAEAEQKRRVVYRTIKEKVYVETTGKQCLGLGAVRLWNEALAGKDVLPGASGDSPAAGTGASDRDVLRNHTDNAEQYKACRDELNRLADWREKNYGR